MIDWARLEFSQPLWAFLFLLLPLVFWIGTRKQGQMIFSSLYLFPQHHSSIRQRISFLPSLLMTLGIGALIFALTGPRAGNKNTQIQKEGISIMVVVDTSSSMRALDLSDDKDRLDILKEKMSVFIRGGRGLAGRANDAIGIIRFAGFADTACPLSLDQEGVLSIVKELSIVEVAEDDGTAIGDALALAVSRMATAKTESKIIILLTDGENNAGEELPLVAADLAASEGITVYTIGIGTNGIAPVPVTDPRTGQTRLQAMSVRIDEALLQEIADRTGGQYFRATDQYSLSNIVKRIDQLEKTIIEENRYREYSEYYGFFSLLGFGFLLLGFFLDATVFRRFP